MDPSAIFHNPPDLTALPLCAVMQLGVTRIDTIDMQKLDEIKDWLTHVKIIYYEVPQPLAWVPIMKEVASACACELVGQTPSS